MNLLEIIYTMPERLLDFIFIRLLYGFTVVMSIEFLIIVLVDYISSQLMKDKKIVKLELDHKTRWFLLHSIINIIVVYYIWDEFWYGMFNLMEMYNKLTNNNAYGVMIALHIYHMIAFPVSNEDIFHHVWFAIGGALLTVAIQPYIATSMALITLNGVPGAIDYALLVLVRIGIIDKIVEKRVNGKLNLWFRMSFSVFMSGCAFCSLLHYQQYICLPCLGIILYNSIYYGNQAILNAYKHELMLK